jgi:hypothetical protein
MGAPVRGSITVTLLQVGEDLGQTAAALLLLEFLEVLFAERDLYIAVKAALVDGLEDPDASAPFVEEPDRLLDPSEQRRRRVINGDAGHHETP